MVPAPKIGLYGGSFDPIHNTHLYIAQEFYKAYALEKVYFVPARQSPLKDEAPQASGKDRLEMLKLAIGDVDHFDVLDWELSQKGPSYTLNLVNHVLSQHPEVDIYFLIGEDQVNQLEKWYEVEDLSQKVIFVAVKRPSSQAVHLPHISGLRLQWLPSELSAISSTEIRKRLQSQQPVDFFLPASVSQYIHSHKLYQ